MSKIKIERGLCSRCGRNLSTSIKILGADASFQGHKAAHDREDLRALIEKWKDKIDPSFLKELEEVLE